MKILQVIHGFPPKQIGGTQLYAQALSEELSKRNEVHIFYPRYDSGPWGISHFHRQKLIIHELSMPLGLFRLRLRSTKIRSSYLDRRIEQIFSGLLDEIKPDIIHIHHLMYLSSSLPQIAKSYNVPVILTLHDYWFMCPLVNLVRSDYTICQGPNQDCSNCYQCWNLGMSNSISGFITRYNVLSSMLNPSLNLICKLRNPRKDFTTRTAYMKSLLLAANKIVAPSEFLRDSFIRFGVPPDKIIFSDKGYDINRFNNLKKLPNRDKTRLIFGYVGGLLKYKGIDVIIDAFNRIKPEDADLRIYGDYDDKSRDFLNLRSRTRNQSIKFVGRYEDIKKPYSEIDVLIFPSICYENRPFVLTEAMISRIPVIASNIGSIPELIENGKNGLLFEAGNHEDLYTKLMIIINNPALLDNLKTASHSVKTIQSDAEETERIYHQTLHNI